MHVDLLRFGFTRSVTARRDNWTKKGFTFCSHVPRTNSVIFEIGIIDE